MPIDKERTIRCYDTVAPLYSFFRKKTHVSDNEIMPFVLDVLAISDGDTVLDAGTGPGIYAIKIAEMADNIKVHGVDLSTKFIELARSNAGKAGLDRVEFSQGDLENLPFDNGHFDKLVCAGVISAVPDKEKAAREIYRVLKRGGRAVVTEPNKGRNIRDRAFLLLLYGLGVINPRLRGFNGADLSRYYFNQDSFYILFRSAGFKMVRVYERAGSICAVCFK